MKTMKKTALALTLICVLMCLFGCKAYIEHKKTFNSMLGTWELNCVYADTKPVEFTNETLTISEDKSAKRSVTTLISEEVEAADGTVTPAQTETKAYNYTVDVPNEGTVNFTDTEGTKAYEFSVDVPAGDLHMYIDIEGVYYHYVYRLVEAQSDSSV